MEKIVKYLEVFRNNALVRRHTNQMKAYQMWTVLTPLLSLEEIDKIRDYWIHYVDNQGIKVEDFGELIRDISKKYESK